MNNNVSKAKTKKNGTRPAFSSVAVTQSFTNPSLSTRITPTINIMPPSLRRKLVYSGTHNYTTGAAGVIGAAQQFSINSLFDPDVTGVGHQPYGFDQIKAFYSAYRVDRVKFKIIATTIGATQEVLVAAYMFSQGGFLTIVGQTTDSVTERQDVMTTLVGASGNVRATEMAASVNIQSLTGRGQQAYHDDPQYSALVTASPALNFTLMIGIGSPSGNAGQALTLQVILEYDAEFWGRVSQAPS